MLNWFTHQEVVLNGKALANMLDAFSFVILPGVGSNPTPARPEKEYCPKPKILAGKRADLCNTLLVHKEKC